MCLTPINVKAKEGTERDTVYVPVPCGKCSKCRQRRINGWVFRLQKEELIHNRSTFVTLTYDPSTMPVTPSGYMSLCKDDVQRFLKRLRFNTGIKTIRYYICGEYGSKSWRPHYHGILFDAEPEAINKAWAMGHCHFGTVTGDSIAYTLKYMDKDGKVPAHAKDDRLPEFALMSKNMGLNYLTPQQLRWHIEKEANHVVLPGGHIQCLPRYYRDKIFNDQDKVRMNRPVQRLHAEKMEAEIKKLMPKHDASDPEEVRQAEAIALFEYYRLRGEAVRHLKNLRNNSNIRDKL